MTKVLLPLEYMYSIRLKYGKQILFILSKQVTQNLKQEKLV